MDASPEGGPAPPRLRRRPLYRDLSVQVAAAMVAGVLLGLFLPRIGAQMQPLGDAFIRLIRMLIAPIIFCTVVHGIAGMGDLRRVGRVALKSLVYFEVMTTLALIFGLTVINLWRPGAGMNIDLHQVDVGAARNYVSQAQQHGVVEFLLGIVPTSAIGAFASGDVIAVLFFSVVFAIALCMIGERAAPAMAVIESVMQALFAAIRIVMAFAPLGAFGSIAFAVGRFGGGALVGLGSLVLCFYLTCFLFIAVCMGAVARLSGFRLWPLVRYLREEILVVLATTTTETVLPRLIAKLERLGCDEAVVGLVVPAGYTFNLEGTCLYITTAAVFLGQATNHPLSLESQVTLVLVALLTAKGSAGVAGSAFITLASTLIAGSSIPVESIALILGIHRLMAEALTFTSILGNAVATIAVARWDGAVDPARLRRELGLSA